MNNKIEWDDKYISGLDEVDEQHKEIIEKVNALYQAIEEGKDKETIINIVESLDSYIEFHFGTEEKYMKIYNFEGYGEHKKTHDFFKNTYEQIRYSYHYIGDNSLPRQDLAYTFALHLSQILIDWLNLHLNTFDRDFAAFVKEKSKI